MSTILPGNQESAALALDGGLSNLMWRRHYLNIKRSESVAEFDDWIRVIYKGNGANTVAIVNSTDCIKYGIVSTILLDGVDVTETIRNSRTYVFNDYSYHEAWFAFTGRVWSYFLRNPVYIDMPSKTNKIDARSIEGRMPWVLRATTMPAVVATSFSAFTGTLYCPSSILEEMREKYSNVAQLEGSIYERRKPFKQLIQDII